MEHRPFGRSGPDVSVIGQGTWYIDDADRPTAVAALRHGIDSGMTHIDTAEMYGDAERKVEGLLDSDCAVLRHDREGRVKPELRYEFTTDP